MPNYFLITPGTQMELFSLETRIEWLQWGPPDDYPAHFDAYMNGIFSLPCGWNTMNLLEADYRESYPGLGFIRSRRSIGEEDIKHLAVSMSDSDVPPDTVFEDLSIYDLERGTKISVAQVWEDRVYFFLLIGNEQEVQWWAESSGTRLADIRKNKEQDGLQDDGVTIVIRPPQA